MRHEMLTDRERRYVAEIAERVGLVRSFLISNGLEGTLQPTVLFKFLSTLREIQGNLSNDVSFAATLMAKEFLSSKFGISFDAADKPQGAPGIDIDIRLPNGERIVAEIKTTVPYQANDFGAQQAASFKKDFAKLSEAKAEHKFLFVTDARAFAALMKPKYLQYLSHIPGVRVVNLVTGDEYAALE